MSSILTSVKKQLGIDADYTQFDQDIIMHINSVFSILTQLGVGSDDGFSITGDTEEWTDFIDEDPRLEMVKSYVGLKVRMIFDPPTSSPIAEAIKQNIAELEYRMYVLTDNDRNEKEKEG